LLKFNTEKNLIKSSALLPIPQFGQAAREELATYPMVTAQVGLPDSVQRQCTAQDLHNIGMLHSLIQNDFYIFKGQKLNRGSQI